MDMIIGEISDDLKRKIEDKRDNDVIPNRISSNWGKIWLDSTNVGINGAWLTSGPDALRAEVPWDFPRSI